MPVTGVLTGGHTQTRASDAALVAACRRDRFKRLLRNWPLKTGGHILAAALVTFIYWSEIPTSLSIGWLALIALASAVLAEVGRRFEGAATPAVSQSAVTAIRVGLTATGVLWGGLAYWILSHEIHPHGAPLAHHEHAMLVVLATGILSTVVAGSLAPLRYGCIGFILAATAPSILHLALTGVTADLVLSSVLATYDVALLLYVRHEGRSFLGEVRARIDNSRLADAIDQGPAAIAVFDAEERLVICNSQYKEFFFPDSADRVQPGT